MAFYGRRSLLTPKERDIRRERRLTLAIEIVIGATVLTAIGIVALAVYYFLYWAP